MRENPEIRSFMAIFILFESVKLCILTNLLSKSHKLSFILGFYKYKIIKTKVRERGKIKRYINNKTNISNRVLSKGS